jgi:DNA-binding SARP family transcriptional activator/TolB-like protein
VRCDIATQTNVPSNGDPGGDPGAPLLRLTLFGAMQAWDSSGRSVLPPSRKTRALFAVLALAAPTPVLRTQLIRLLWSRRQNEQARASLRQAVHELRAALGPLAGELLRADRNHILLFGEYIWVDVRALAAATASEPYALEFFQRALLDDLIGLDPAFDQWLEDERRRLTRHARSVADAVLAEQCEAGLTIKAAERLLFIDPTHEGAWQALIRAHLDQGDRAAARLALNQCTTTLSNVGLNPSRATEELAGIMPFVPLRSKGAWRPREEVSGIRISVLPPRALDGERLNALSLGLAEEISTALAQFRWISCVDNSLLATTGGLSKIAGHAWQRPDLDFLLDSTLQCSGSRIRIIARLLDVHAGGKIAWARRFDREVVDILKLQGEIAAEIAVQIDHELLIREGERLAGCGLNEPNTHDLILRAIPAIYRLDQSGFRAAGEVLAAAFAGEPGNAAANAWWAYWHVLLVGQGWASDPISATTQDSWRNGQ